MAAGPRGGTGRPAGGGGCGLCSTPRRKLEPHFTPEGKLPLTKWRTERGKLQQAYQEDYAKYKPIRDDLMKLYQVKSTVDTARRRQEQAHTQRRDRDMER